MSNKERLEDAIEIAIKEACIKFGYDYESTLIKVGIARFLDEDPILVNNTYGIMVLNMFKPSYEAKRIKELETLEELLIGEFQRQNNLIKGKTRVPFFFEEKITRPTTPEDELFLQTLRKGKAE